MNTVLLCLLSIFLAAAPAQAKVQSVIHGESPQEVQKNAFRQNMDYPVSEMRCSQRCSQLWERD